MSSTFSPIFLFVVVYNNKNASCRKRIGRPPTQSISAVSYWWKILPFSRYIDLLLLLLYFYTLLYSTPQLYRYAIVWISWWSIL